MKRYFVDFISGTETTCEAEGQEAASAEAARDDALRLLTEIARIKIAEAADCILVAVVRDAVGEAVYRVMLTATCTRLG